MKNVMTSLISFMGLFFLISSAPAAGQSNNASVSGLVADASRAVLPGVAISAKNTQTGIVTTSVSNESGAYSMPSLQPGIYKVTAELPGFETFVYNSVELEVSAQIRLNFSMTIAPVAQTVEVTAGGDSPLAVNTATIGSVISNQRVQELPIPDHSVLNLLQTVAGVVGDSVNGNRATGLNITMNGVNTQTQRFDVGTSNFFNSIDLVEQVRIVTAPADAEFGRGQGQVQLTMRSGTNQFHGSIFESLRNDALNANTFFNNLNGIKRPVLKRSQFGARIGGPVLQSKLFFFFLYEGQRQYSGTPITQTVLTKTAREGTFRYFPGVRNANANQTGATVDLLGNPIPPSSSATLQSVNLFSLDPLRPAADPTGMIRKLVDNTPLPNTFRAGDGLNTAGYAWNQRSFSNRDDVAFRVDYYLSQKHNLNFSYQRETSASPYHALAYPDSPNDANTTNTLNFMTLQVTTILSPTVVNTLSSGFQHPFAFMAAASYTPQGQPLLAVAPGGTKYIVTPSSFTSAMRALQTTTRNVVPYYSLGDTLSKNLGRHALKVGAEYHWLVSNSYNNTPNVVPQAVLGAGGSAVTGVSALSGIVANQTLAQNILTDLSGSVASLTQTYIVPFSQNPQYLPGYPNLRVWNSREFQGFFKDDFKVSPSVTLNLGLRYEYYSVPWENHGMVTGLVGGSSGLFGISGKDMSALFKPGASGGSLTQPLPIGKNSPTPGQKLFPDNWGNFAPAVGFSWSLPFWGKDKTVVRAGYSITYVKNSAFKTIDNLISLQSGPQTNVTLQPSTYLNLTGVNLPLTPSIPPFAVLPFTDRTQTAGAYDNNLKVGYVPNINVSIERELPFKSSISLRYIGNRGHRLPTILELNEVNIFENGILDAFLTTQSGGNALLFDQIFSGLNLGSGIINGSSVTASASLRANSITQGFFANNNPGGFGNFLNTTTNFTGVAGGLLRRANLPENFIVVNPQYTTGTPGTPGVGYGCNCTHSSYDSLQLEYNKRFSDGLSLLSSYVFSKNLGTGDGNIRTLRNMELDKRRLAADRTHVLKFSGTYDLPFGPGKMFVQQRALGHIVGGWQVGAIFTRSSGAPLNITAASTSFNQSSQTASVLGAVLNDMGEVTKLANGQVIYFSGLSQVTDPSAANVTTLQNLNTRTTMLAIVNSQGQPVFVNPRPGTMGALAANYLTGPGYWNLDLNLLKRIAVTERYNVEFRLDALNAPNNVQWSNPNGDINSQNFGRITNTAASRLVIANLRINF